MVLGGIAFVFSLIPFVGIFAIPLSALGLLVGIVGGVVALTRRGRGIGFPIAGVGLSVTALLIGLFWFHVLHTAVKELLPSGEEAKIKIAKSNIEALTHQCEIYAIDHNGHMPPTLAALVNPGDGHAAYVQEKALKDPWGSVFQYDPRGKKNGGNRPDIWTVSPKGLTIGNWD
jgi:hypothetical protein